MDETVRGNEGFALILGASSGFGEATALALASSGMDIIGVHLDRRAGQERADALVKRIEAMGRQAWFYNVNAASDEKRRATLDDLDAFRWRTGAGRGQFRRWRWIGLVR